MKLIFGGTSPYSRKIRIAIREMDLSDQVQQIARNPFEEPEDVRKANPLGKVPALIFDDGTSLFDSPLVLEFLDTLTSPKRLLPEVGSPARWEVLRLQALADGILDATLNISCEYRRPAEERSATWVAHWASAIDRGLDELEKQVEAFPDEMNAGTIAAACVPDYVALRASDHVNWRQGRPKLAAWHDAISTRSSLKETHPALSA